PFAFDLPVAIGHAKSPINVFPTAISAGDMLYTMAEPKIIARSNSQVGDLGSYRPVEAREHAPPVLTISAGTDILAWRYHVENEQAVVWHVNRHHAAEVLGSDRIYQMAFKRGDFSLVVVGLRFNAQRRIHCCTEGQQCRHD